MGVSDVEEASLSLDEKLLRFMDQLELLEEKRAKLNSLIEQGWFSISKARYSMGNKQVSALQYASEIEPLVFVNSRRLENCGVEFCTERPNQERNTSSSIEDIGPKESGVRRRNKPKNDAAEKEASKDASSEKTPELNPVNESHQNPQQDPLKWFGILVPQSLKQAQSSFKQVIELSAEIATLQDAISNSRQELSLSLKNKQTAAERVGSPLGQGDKLNGSGESKQKDSGGEVPIKESL
ncbi:vacuolar ATPase assembly protein VMA22 isoform X2 [Salarias fasciatus]|uniref:Vacuolar ATPase assembly protein VMA22 n=2 Tax=Salarias fasciatus TaxID=181472 RepID=A0A672GWS3_SALFA|nr:coiled-coil domain-containing protein 115 isoform X2 [Salarias fasciatus]